MTLDINDPAGVKALLDQLRGSQAWKDITAPSGGGSSVSPGESDDQRPASLNPLINPPNDESTSVSVASLLSQLQSSSALGLSNTPTPPSVPKRPIHPLLSVVPTPAPAAVPAPAPAIAPVVPPQDLRSLTYQQALPRIAQLANDEKFVAAIKQMKMEQDDLERQLWESRGNIHRKYEDKVKVAMTKANMTGDSGLSKHEAEMLQTGLKKELEKFDRERILVAWDGLVSKQQATLASLGVPTMFKTNDTPDRERQQRVMHVLEDIIYP